MKKQLNEVWDALRASQRHRDDALSEVRIRKLRGIEDLRVPLQYPVSVLAGPNGSGKSTVLFACACAYRVPGRSPRECYSEFHMSSGERSVLRISKDISGLGNALVLIDEVDTGLHPYTQQQAMLELQN